MISPLEIYLIMQLDSIGLFLAILGFALTVLTIALVFFQLASYDCSFDSQESKDQRKENRATARRITPRIALAAVVLMGLSSLIPSTKTAAAMFVIPAIANNENIRREAGDLYQLAKQALTELATEKEGAK